ncbi:MAG: aldo/keto reductase [Sphingobacterium sp.]
MRRRTFIKSTGAAVLGTALGVESLNAASANNNKGKTMTESQNSNNRFRPASKVGFGGVPLGNGFNANPDIECLQAMESAWDAGVRYYDTSPWYGLGISERRMGMFLKDKARQEYQISTKIGRLLEPHDDFELQGLWKGKLNASYVYDFTAEGARRSVEDSLQRLGIGSLDIVFIHDLSPDNGDMKDNWLEYFDIAVKGAMPELTKMREEGLIKGWGLGVNTTEPILKTIEVADPDIFLSACQYSLIHHKDDLNQVFPKLAQRDMSIVVGAPLCGGFLSGKDRYLYGSGFPAGVKEKLAALKQVADRHSVDLRTAALRFSAAPDVVSAVIPGAHTVQQAAENAASFKTKIPAAFWEELKLKKLIEENAPTPK